MDMGKNAPINPAECYANICIVFSENGKHNSSTSVKKNKLEKYTDSTENYNFEVIQFVYNCTILTYKNAQIINKMIQQIPSKGKYNDPLMTNVDKHAGIYKLMPNQAIQTLVTPSFVGIGPKQMIPQNMAGYNARPSAKKSYGADYVSESNNNENKQDTNMKTENRKRNVVRLTESQLEKVITESLRTVLSEGINNSLHEDLNNIIQSLEQLANSKYIPFSSPSPSSTESVVKQNVKKAIGLLKFADIAAQQLSHGVQRY